MNKHIEYKTKGVCSKMIIIDVEDGVVSKCSFVGGCAGNTQGVARLAEGMPATVLVERLKGVQCRGNNSCPNQFALAIEQNI